ncbi:TPA: hypothetical protein RQK93_003639 [Vibrio vulnificus]|nr:hypothetical protein [Vibrio vulnificus]HAT7741029.1 hypothetical protein [Vibrio vulnificus]HDY8071402.1 hypothetical protein [Vibrio vulnificus]
MKSYQVTIDIHSEWHVGSGEEGGTYADALVLKNSHNLPFLPGKALKGLFRDSFLVAHDNRWFGGELTTEAIELLFGHQGQVEHTHGALSFSNAELSSEESAYFELYPEHTRHCYRVHFSTAINGQTGVAKQTSLRAMEVAIPLRLYARIELDDQRLDSRMQQQVNEWLEMCSTLILGLGAKRTRGLGQATVSIEPVGVQG